MHGEHAENHEPGDHQEDVEDQGGDEHVDEVIQVVGEGSGGEVCMTGVKVRMVCWNIGESI